LIRFQASLSVVAEVIPMGLLKAKEVAEMQLIKYAFEIRPLAPTNIVAFDAK
jgi:hypothetical protein